MKQLHRWVDQAMADNQEELGYVIRTSTDRRPPQAASERAVETAIVTRSDASDSMRNDALNALAKQQKTTPSGAIVGLIDTVGKTDPQGVYHLLRLLPIQPADDLKAQPGSSFEIDDLRHIAGSSRSRVGFPRHGRQLL